MLNGRFDAFHMTGERHSNRYVFSTLIKCKHCHRSFRRIERQFKNSRYIRWVCSSRNGDGRNACHNETKIVEDEPLEEINKYLEGWIDNKEAMMEETFKQYMEKQGGGEGEMTSKKLREELRRNHKKQEKLQEMYMNDIISMEELKEKSHSLKKKIEEIKGQLSVLGKANYSEEEIRKYIDDLFGDIRNILNAETITNTMLKQLIQKIEVDSSGRVEVFIRKIGDGA